MTLGSSTTSKSSPPPVSTDGEEEAFSFKDATTSPTSSPNRCHTLLHHRHDTSCPHRSTTRRTTTNMFRYRRSHHSNTHHHHNPTNKRTMWGLLLVMGGILELWISISQPWLSEMTGPQVVKSLETSLAPTLQGQDTLAASSQQHISVQQLQRRRRQVGELLVAHSPETRSDTKDHETVARPRVVVLWNPSTTSDTNEITWPSRSTRVVQPLFGTCRPEHAPYYYYYYQTSNNANNNVMMYSDTCQRLIQETDKLRNAQRQPPPPPQSITNNSIAQQHDDCTYMADWQSTSYPTCNTLHELVHLTTLQLQKESHMTNNNHHGTTHAESRTTLLSRRGSWRTVWHHVQVLPLNYTDNVVLKTLKVDREFDFVESLETTRVDAMAMERLTKSPYIMNVYAHCGQSLVTEYANGIYSSARMRVKDPSLSSLQRLELGRELAHAFADIHSIDVPQSRHPSLAHNDVNMANTIVDATGRIKINDFNIAILGKERKLDNGTTIPCGSPVRFNATLWKSPEEIANQTFIDPSLADVYGLGNLLFQVLTKHQPWTHLEPNGKLTLEEVGRFKIAGQMPHFPDKFVHANKTALSALYYATLACYRQDPQQRLTSYELARNLDFIYNTLKNQHKTIAKQDLEQMFDREFNTLMTVAKDQREQTRDEKHDTT